MYECHVTIEPVFDARLELASNIAEKCSFKVANLLMQKRSLDTPERSKNDTFMTSHSESKDVLISRMTQLIIALHIAGFKVWRYKIEEILIDSKFQGDIFKLIGDK